MAIAVGTRVHLLRPHPWAGHTGKVVRYEGTPWGKKPVVEGRHFSCFVLNAEQMQVLKEHV